MNTTFNQLTGLLLIISGYSGSGKGRLKQELAGRNVIKPYITVTTRSPREGEIDGVHYHFWNAPRFIEFRDRGGFLEWSQNHGNGDDRYYGTPLEPLSTDLRKGERRLLEVDVQGHDSICEHPDEIFRESKISFFLKVPTDTAVRRICAREPGISQRDLDARVASMQMEEMRASRYDFQIEHPDGETGSVADRILQMVERRLIDRDCVR